MSKTVIGVTKWYKKREDHERTARKERSRPSLADLKAEQSRLQKCRCARERRYTLALLKK